MTQTQPPPLSQPAGIHVVPDGFTGPAPWSALAISAFVCSLLGFLGVTAILGIILGIAGILVTSGGKRRGMGLAIAALPISILTGLLSMALVVLFMATIKVATTMAAILPVFDAAALDRPQAMVEFRKFTSRSFDDEVSDEQFFAWVDHIVEQHGKLTEISARLRNKNESGQESVGDQALFSFSIPAKFINGDATIQITFQQDAIWETRLDDISVAGVSPRDSR